MFQALTVRFVKQVQLLGGARAADELMARQDDRLNAAGQERFGSRATNVDKSRNSALRIALSKLPSRSALSITSHRPTPRARKRFSRIA